MNQVIENKLVEANNLREKESFADSAKIYTECLIELTKAQDVAGLIHCLGGQSHIYKILAKQTKNEIYQNLGIAFAKEAYQLGRNNQVTLDGRTLSIAYSTYADTLLAKNQLAEALPIFEKALEVSTADVPEKGRLKAHIGGIKYLQGQKESGLALIKSALIDIRTGDMNQSYIRTWETGVLNSLSKIFAQEGDVAQATYLINESLDISQKHQLSIREKEAKEIKELISSGKTDFSL